LVCNENFDKFWDSDEEEWMYSDAMVSESNNQIYHLSCFENKDIKNRESQNHNTEIDPQNGSLLGKRQESNVEEAPEPKLTKVI